MGRVQVHLSLRLFTFSTMCQINCFQMAPDGLIPLWLQKCFILINFLTDIMPSHFGLSLRKLNFLCVEMSLMICLSLLTHRRQNINNEIVVCKEVHSEMINQDKPFLTANTIFPLGTQKVISLLKTYRKDYTVAFMCVLSVHAFGPICLLIYECISAYTYVHAYL